MIEAKEKPCKGTGLALGHGCGVLTKYRARGLGKMCCYNEWLLTSENGKILLAKAEIKGKSIERKKEKKAWNTRKAKMKENVETKPDVEKILEKEINKIVRLIDKGHECISSGRGLGKNYDAGHYYSKGSNATIRFHLFNIYAQSVHDNRDKSANIHEYRERLESVFSFELLDYVESLKKHPVIKLSIPELKEKILIARRIVKSLLHEDREYSMRERMSLRIKFNKELGIYEY